MLTFPQPTCFGGMCTIAPQGDFGHPPMTLTELVPHLRQRAARFGGGRIDEDSIKLSEVCLDCAGVVQAAREVLG